MDEDEDSEFSKGYWAAIDDFPAQLERIQNDLNTLVDLYKAQERTKPSVKS